MNIYIYEYVYIHISVTLRLILEDHQFDFRAEEEQPLDFWHVIPLLYLVKADVTV